MTTRELIAELQRLPDFVLDRPVIFCPDYDRSGQRSWAVSGVTEDARSDLGTVTVLFRSTR